MDTVKWLKDTFGWDYPPLKMYPEEIRTVIRDYERMNRCSPAVESECAHARTMFLLLGYGNEPEYYDVDTSERRVSRLRFFKCYRGRRETFENLEIRPKEKAFAAVSK